MRRSRTLHLVAGFALVCVLSATILLVFSGHLGPADSGLQRLGYDERTGTRYLPLPSDPFRAPYVRELDVPSFADAKSVWGATGRDSNGGIWVGVSASSAGISAHLLQYDPEADSWWDRGVVVEKLKQAGLYREGEGQVKIHSKIVPADDGLLYFASMDEDGEDASAKSPPRWGGHLWRIDPRNYRWQHVMAVPEGLIAVSGVGRYVYALGYWDHVLYQYDTATTMAKRVVTGSVGSHVSRNFLADASGHAYVPRLRIHPNGGILAELVEYDSDLHELAATPLDFYIGAESPDANHGIVGVAYLADGRMLFTTHLGQLYVIEPKRGSAAAVRALGWFHPDGEAYAPSLFSFDGRGLVAGVTNRANRYEWVVFDLGTGISGAFPMDTKGLRNVLLYGSLSRDNAGRFYVGGWASGTTGGQRPLVLQISAAP